MGNNRGTEYSRGHKDGMTIDDPTYWKFSFYEMGMYDDPANVKMIKEKTGEDKIYYVGYSQGTIQMFIALIKNKDTDIAGSLHKYVALAPCTIAAAAGTAKDYEDTLFKLEGMGIYAIYNTPTWTS